MNQQNKTSGNAETLMYKVEDIQIIFGVGKNVAYQIMETSGFPKIVIGKRSFVPRDRLQKWIDQNIGKTIQTTW